MAAKSFLKGLTERATTRAGGAGGKYGDAPVIGMNDAARRLAVLDDCEDAAFSCLWASDAQGRLIYVSPKAVELLGCSPDDLLARPLVEIFEIDPNNPNGKSDRPLKFQLSAHSKIKDLIVRVEHGRDDAGARRAWWSISGNPKSDASGTFLGYRGSAKDVTVEYENQLQDSRLAEYDSLTGLANRHRMDRLLDGTLAAFRAAKRSCALFMIDLDKFKHVNDTMGHQAGDELLKQVSDRLQRIIGDKGEVGRLGGDEFQVILPDMDDRGELGELADKVIQMLSLPYPIGDKRAIIGASVGVAIAPYDGLDRDALSHSADLSLYAAKNSGRGQFRFFSHDLKDVADERQQLMEDLREALAADALELHYQPVVRIDDNLVVGFEGLMRWNHPERGFVSPGTFIPIAEESNLIIQLGDWALRRACRDAVAWPQSVKVAVNVSALQFANPGFLDTVADVLESAAIDPGRVELELTESVFMGDNAQVDATFKGLKDLGVKLALDDFGTGYSSLSYLRSAPFDRIKVDKTFVDSCTAKDQNSAKIIAAIIGLSNALGIETTVEGVEAFDQLDLVRQKGARNIQGWIYSKALPQNEVLERMSLGTFKIEPDGPDRYRAERRTVFKRIGVIHEDYRLGGVMRDMSKTGARIEGLFGLPLGTALVLDLGEGQLAVCEVTRVRDGEIGVEFETPLVSDGAGGLCTRNRISPYALAAAGMPLEALPKGSYPLALKSRG
ncbi:MAG: EAL domain-containing protein [Sphingomonadales bacterium]|nr:EAL domain-containing protein [Sphingomonadales bacterium]MDE2569328.1 EAL domain-containing protein [Sphingomonadales bacterium]